MRQKLLYLANIAKAELNLLAAKHLKLDEWLRRVGDKAKCWKTLKPMLDNM